MGVFLNTQAGFFTIVSYATPTLPLEEVVAKGEFTTIFFGDDTTRDDILKSKDSIAKKSTLAARYGVGQSSFLKLSAGNLTGANSSTNIAIGNHGSANVPSGLKPQQIPDDSLAGNLTINFQVGIANARTEGANEYKSKLVLFKFRDFNNVDQNKQEDTVDLIIAQFDFDKLRKLSTEQFTNLVNQSVEGVFNALNSCFYRLMFDKVRGEVGMSGNKIEYSNGSIQTQINGLNQEISTAQSALPGADATNRTKLQEAIADKKELIKRLEGDRKIKQEYLLPLNMLLVLAIGGDWGRSGATSEANKNSGFGAWRKLFIDTMLSIKSELGEPDTENTDRKKATGAVKKTKTEDPKPTLNVTDDERRLEQEAERTLVDNQIITIENLGANRFSQPPETVILSLLDILRNEEKEITLESLINAEEQTDIQPPASNDQSECDKVLTSMTDNELSTIDKALDNGIETLKKQTGDLLMRLKRFQGLPGFSALNSLTGFPGIDFKKLSFSGGSLKGLDFTSMINKTKSTLKGLGDFNFGGMSNVFARNLSLGPTVKSFGQIGLDLWDKGGDLVGTVDFDAAFKGADKNKCAVVTEMQGAVDNPQKIQEDIIAEVKEEGEVVGNAFTANLEKLEKKQRDIENLEGKKLILARAKSLKTIPTQAAAQARAKLPENLREKVSGVIG